MKTRKKTGRNRSYSAKTLAARKKRLHARRPVHKKLLLHPIFIFFFLCVGVALVMLTLKAGADTLTVTASNPGKPPGSPAVITSPPNGSHFTSTPISVSGTCPSDTYVKLYRNDVFSGVAICLGDDTFHLKTDLFTGANRLVAHVYNFADVEGPVSQPVTVYLDKVFGNPSSPLTISSEFLYQGFYAGTEFSWKIQVMGGTAPYAVNIKWGDGQESTIARKDDSAFFISHKYTAPGTYKGEYPIDINASDAAGAAAYLQLMAIIVSKGTLVHLGSTTIGGGGVRQWLWLVWPAYSIVILMLISFWLGEREELYKILKASKSRKRSA